MASPSASTAVTSSRSGCACRKPYLCRKITLSGKLGDAVVIRAHGPRAFAAAAGPAGVISEGERADRSEAGFVAAIAGVLCRRHGGSGGEEAGIAETPRAGH
jgi:hypothetical protein